MSTSVLALSLAFHIPCLSIAVVVWWSFRFALYAWGVNETARLPTDLGFWIGNFDCSIWLESVIVVTMCYLHNFQFWQSHRLGKSTEIGASSMWIAYIEIGRLLVWFVWVLKRSIVSVIYVQHTPQLCATSEFVYRLLEFCAPEW